MVLVFGGSAIPGRSIPRVWIFSFDKVIHFLEYGLGGALCAFAMGEVPAARAILVGAVFASLYGATDELHQLFVPGRLCDVRDWIADTAGGTAGAVFGHVFRPLVRRLIRDRFRRRHPV